MGILDELPEAAIEPHPGAWKFIVVRISAAEGHAKTIVRSGNGSHDDIFSSVYWEFVSCGREHEYKSHKVVCLGGGRIHFNLEAMTIHVWGSSGEYGREPDRARTIEVIKATQPGFAVIESSIE